MAILKIVKTPNKILKEKSKRIQSIDDDIRSIAFDLSETVEDKQGANESGVAMAAIQAGIPLKLIVVREENGDYLVFANAEIVKTYGEEKEDLEGCLSVPGIYGFVSRPEKIKVKALDLNNKEVDFKAEGLLSRILQHEIDHTNGILFTDHIKDINKLYRLRDDGKLIDQEGKVLDEGPKEI